jgi:hypothetical protein
LPWLPAELTVKFRVIARSHAALKNLGISAAIKEPGRDAQCTDPVAGCPRGPDFVGLAIHVRSRARRTNERLAL